MNEGAGVKERLQACGVEEEGRVAVAAAAAGSIGPGLAPRLYKA